MNIKNKIKKYWIGVRSLFYSIPFNFRHLPFSQACHLPILLYKPDLRENSGKFKIDAPLRFGMIKLGFNTVSIFPNNGIILENRGSIYFKGPTWIGNNSAISVGETGLVEFGEKFSATTGLRLACYHHISFDKNVLIGWNTQIVDTDFHALKKVNKMGGGKTLGFGPISIGHDVWIANGCKIYKNVSIPHSCVVGADTILHKAIECPPNSLIMNRIETEIRTGFYRDGEDDKISYPDMNS